MVAPGPEVPAPAMGTTAMRSDDGTVWSIAQVARMSGVTSRTLRHYDAVGLLRPVGTSGSGHRWYGEEQLLRLQQILLLRQLGLGLEAIGQILDGRPAVQVLRHHHRWLLSEQARLDQLASTVADTIAQLEGEQPMAPEQWFDGFDAERQARYEAELVERLGEGVRPHIEESRRRMRGWTKAEAEMVAREYDDVEGRLVVLIEEGAEPDDPRVYDVLDAHYATVSRFWTPDRDSYAGLGRLYVDSADFKARYDARHPRLAEFLRDSMAAYAHDRLP